MYELDGVCDLYCTEGPLLPFAPSTPFGSLEPLITRGDVSVLYTDISAFCWWFLSVCESDFSVFDGGSCL